MKRASVVSQSEPVVPQSKKQRTNSFLQDSEENDAGNDGMDDMDLLDVEADMLADQDDVDEMLAAEAAPPPVSEDSAPTGMTFSGDGACDFKMIQNMWKRPPLPAMNPATDAIHLQSIDIDYYVAQAQSGYLGAQSGEVPVVRIFGVTNDGHSVAAHVHGFSPYFYFDTPPGFVAAKCGIVRKALNDALITRASGEARDKFLRHGAELVLRVELVTKRSIMFYSDNDSISVLKVTTASPAHVPTLRGILERGFDVDGSGNRMFQTYESNILFALRFMVDCQIMGASWLTLPAGTYKMKTQKATRCQIEVDIGFQHVLAHKPEGEWQKLPPLRILSFDIECAGRKGVFPDASVDPVIQIATLLTIQGQQKPLVRTVLTLKECAPIAGAHVMSFDKEEDLLRMWSRLFGEVDPDFVTGYNIVNFDLPYLLNRAKALKVKDFGALGRVTGRMSVVRDSTFSSKQVGTRESKEINIEGRVQFDLLQVLQRDYKLRSYSLNSVSAHFLGEQKEDVHYSSITDLQNGDAQTRRRLAVYCLKDALLPQRLLDKLMCIYNYTEMARVTGVPTTYLLTKGQQVKVITQLYRKANQQGMIIPCVKATVTAGDDVAYEGATVIDPIKGFYDVPIATLDFASLYPSIMMAHNLCYSTLVPKSSLGRLSLPADALTRTPSGDVFVKPSVRKGLLPEILEELLGARKRAKADLKKATDPFEKAVLDGRQLALKISANSVYGFTGATVGKLACLEIASSVTAFGRQMIDQTKLCVEQRYTIANGYVHNAVVVYGDTDSVMVKFGTTEIGEAMNLGRDAADFVSQTFLKPIKLEFEKCYFPYLLMNKKRYAGMLWTNADKPDKMDTKGIETVRRDNCPLVSNMIQTCLNKILIDRSLEDAKQYAKQVISDLLQNKIDLSMLVISKALTKNKDAYDAKQAHVELAERMRKRDPGSAPGIGDRVAYVIIKAGKGARGYEKSEDPIFVLEHNIPIDTEHYLEHQLKQPLLRIFEPIMEDPKTLFTGEHTRSIHKSTPSTGGIMKFAKKVASCVNCKTTISGTGDETVLCHHCKPLEADILMQKLQEANELETKFSRLWTQCQRCQGNLHQEVLCAARDCPIFYMRKKVQKDLNDALTVVGRFDVDEW
eukprot:c23049_g1_i1.p1 GENE.c23049_g1_i1~~c23049_g1_i1.p1  ORF type:complete len:1142 (+),score=357.53 c23049_g1_i1:43-3426(+)